MEYPEGFKAEIEKILGNKSSKFFDAMTRRARASVRVNSRKFSSAGDLKAVAEMLGMAQAEVHRVDWCSTGYYLDRRPVFTLNPGMHGGLFYAQDASSMIHREILTRLISSGQVAEDAVVLDACAAPGGKTTAMIDALGDGAVVVANEYDGRRCAILRENLMKWGYGNVVVTQGDTSAYRNVEELFDVVAVDAPCSGEGMMRKEEEAARQWSNRLVENCATLQREILDNIHTSLKNGGILIYSTCTYNRQENEENVEYLMSQYGYESIDMEIPEEWGIGKGIDTDAHCLRFMPHLVDGEGQFVAVLRKRPEASLVFSQESLVFRKGKRREKERREKEWRDNTDEVKGWIADDVKEEYDIVERGEALQAVKHNVRAVVEKIEPYAKITAEGVEVAKRKGKILQPSAGLALSGIYSKDMFPRIDADEATAISFLRRESIATSPEMKKGYAVVAYKGNGLGFVKNVGGRGNNLYPEAWKIRMGGS